MFYDNSQKKHTNYGAQVIVYGEKFSLEFNTNFDFPTIVLQRKIKKTNFWPTTSAWVRQSLTT